MRSSAETPWENVILAMLAVSHYTIDRVVELRNRLGEVGLLEPRNLSLWGVDRVANTLRLAGYDRGRLTTMYADRLVSLGKLFEREGSACEMTLRAGTDDEVRSLLLPWHGVGPTVVSNYLYLRRR
jgi:hypothetical protein